MTLKNEQFYFSNKMTSEEISKGGNLFLQLTGNAESRPTCESRASGITSVCFLKPGVIISARSSICAILGHFLLSSSHFGPRQLPRLPQW